MKELSLDRIIAAASASPGKGRAGHSQLYEWLWARYDDLTTALLPPRTPNWTRIAEEFATLAQGGEAVNDGSGKPPKAITCRQTWAKVCRDKEKVETGNLTRRRRRTNNPATAAPTALPNPEPKPALSLPDAGDDDAQDGFVLRLAGGPKTFKPEDPSDD